MWYKEQSEIIIFPRVFKGIKIAYQGDYSFRFELIHEPEQGSKKSAYPYIFKSQNQFLDKSLANVPMPKVINSANEQKTRGAYTHIENNQGYFETKSFTIKYENHVEELNDICIFKHEQKMKMKGEFYLLVSLQSHRKTISKIERSSEFLSESKIKTVYAKKLFLNRTSKEINQFLEVELTDNDYFGTLEMYVGSAHLGWKLRNNKMNLCEFLSLDTKLKEKYVEESRAKDLISSKSTAGKKIKEAVQDYIDENNSYHGITIIKSIKEMKRILNCLIKVVESLKTKLADPFSEYFSMVQSFQEQTAIITLENMKEYYECNTENTLYFAIHYENTRLAEHIKSLWQKYIEIIKHTSLEEFIHLCGEDIKHQDIEWSGKSLRFISTEIKRSLSLREESMDLNSPQLIHRSSMFDVIKKSNQAEEKRNFRGNTEKSIKDNILDIRCSEIENFKVKREELLENSQVNFEEDISHPYMIFENFSENYPRPKIRPEKSLVVFIHGFKGNEYDLEKASEYLLKYNPRVDILRVRTILPDADHSIEEMSHIVSNEIKKHLVFSPKIESISIIGYSLGGVIGRACLGHLSQFKDKMNLFVTFSSPHLGTHLTGNNLVKAGIWFMINFDKCKALEELNTCRDLKTANKSYMKTLSEQNHLKWFKKVVLVSCKEDEFVPHLSSRIQEYERRKTYNNDDDNDIDTNFEDSDRAKINKVKSVEKIFASQGVKREISETKEMSENIRSVCNRIERVEVWFDMEKRKGTIDKLTGRQAHIEFLDNNRFLKWFFKLYAKQL